MKPMKNYQSNRAFGYQIQTTDLAGRDYSRLFDSERARAARCPEPIIDFHDNLLEIVRYRDVNGDQQFASMFGLFAKNWSNMDVAPKGTRFEIWVSGAQLWLEVKVFDFNNNQLTWGVK